MITYRKFLPYKTSIIKKPAKVPYRQKAIIFQLENDIKITIKETTCGDDCEVKTNTTCEEDEETEERTNIIKRKADFEEVTHRNNNIRRRNNKINVKFQVRGKYVNHTHLADNITLGNNQLYIRYQQPTFICPIGFVPRKNRCGKPPKTIL